MPSLRPAVVDRRQRQDVGDDLVAPQQDMGGALDGTRQRAGNGMMQTWGVNGVAQMCGRGEGWGCGRGGWGMSGKGQGDRKKRARACSRFLPSTSTKGNEMDVHAHLPLDVYRTLLEQPSHRIWKRLVKAGGRLDV